jgi:hypothetical protein
MRRAATHTSHAAMNRALDDALRAEMDLYREQAQLPADPS